MALPLKMRLYYGLGKYLPFLKIRPPQGDRQAATDAAAWSEQRADLGETGERRDDPDRATEYACLEDHSDDGEVDERAHRTARRTG